MRIALQRRQPLLNPRHRVLDRQLRRLTIESTVRPELVAHGTTQQLVNRHIQRFALDVPQSDVDPADRRHVQHTTAQVVTEVVEHLPRLLDPERVTPHKYLSQLLDHTRNLRPHPS